MSMNAQAKSTILGIATAITISVGAMTVYTQQSDKAHSEAMEEREQTNLRDFVSDIDELAYKRVGYTDDVDDWTTALIDMPASAERSAFSQAVVDATHDNVITDDEYMRLEEGFVALEGVNKARKVHELVAKYVPESELELETTTSTTTGKSL